ncbi:MAG: Ig-like domain-containing protein [Bacteroidaceae bacterium]|nr:Ig-like domain-containing protein [Bacteroidaceae bacterium]
MNKNNLNKSFYLLLLAIVALIVASCARMGSPDGGWYDEEPPYVLATSPMENAINFDGNRVYLLFNEYIKLENAQEKVVVSPPQLEQPEIKLQGNRIRIELKDSLLPGQTYTIDFSDCISDNNEGNPMGNYTFTFSTGDHIDTMEVSGSVIDAETFEPIKGALVGLYENDLFEQEKNDSLSLVKGDTIFRTQAMIRVSRSDDKGHFNIKGVARDKKYRIFALEDMDGDLKYSQKSEGLAFTDRIISPDCYPDTRLDTIWLDALRIKDLVRVPYTHFTPDDIVLRMFKEKMTERHLVKTERKNPEMLGVFFTYGHEYLPSFRPLNFEAEAGIDYLVESNLDKDSITYWLSDSLLINNDSLTVELGYFETDTTGTLVQKIDTFMFTPKLGYEKRQKIQEEEYKKWQKAQEKVKKKGGMYQTEYPRKALEVKWNGTGTVSPDNRITFSSPSPVALIDTTKFHLMQMVDTVWQDKPFVIEKDSVINRLYHIVTEFNEKEEYKLLVDSFAIRDVYDQLSNAYSGSIKIGEADNYGRLIVNLEGVSGKQFVVQLLTSGGDKVFRQIISEKNRIEFKYLKAGDYYLRLLIDDDGDGKFTTGLYEENRQPEAVYFYSEKIEVKEKWDKTISWNPNNTRLDKQKPQAIIKQKGEKKRQRSNRNMDRARKMGLKFLPNGTPVTEDPKENKR